MTQISPAFSDATTFSLPLSGGGEPIHPRYHVRLAPQPSVSHAYLIGQISNDLFITQPFQINFERDDDGTHVVSDDLFLVYGSGDNQNSALQDYVSSLIEFYEILKKSAPANKFDKGQLTILEKYIQSKPQRGIHAIQAVRD